MGYTTSCNQLPLPLRLSPSHFHMFLFGAVSVMSAMPNGTYFQSASLPTPPPPTHPASPPYSSSKTAAVASSSASDYAAPNDATAKLTEAIDDFLGDLEKKFKGISDEILTKLDDMAERCDRLEQEILLRDASAMENTGKASTGSNAGSS